MPIDGFRQVDKFVLSHDERTGRAFMADIVIFGAGPMAELAHFYFTHDSGHRVVGFTVDAAYLDRGGFCGLPLVAFEELPSRFPAARHDAFVALSYSGFNQLRAGKCAAMKALGYRLCSYVSSRATVFADFRAGENCYVLENSTIQPSARIANNVTLWSGSILCHHATIEDNVFVSAHVAIAGGATVGEGCFLGANSTIRDHVRLGRRSVIGAGALILGDTEEGSVYASPAARKSPVPSHRLRRI
jgi:sugar O-acyltransferase (sialic acid O-acetyltransferase NeuD family)